MSFVRPIEKGERQMTATVPRTSSERRARLAAIRAALLQAGARVVASRRAGRAQLAAEGTGIRVVDAARHIAVHFPHPELLARIRARHPELACGLRCVRIRDTQYVPVYELREAFARALSGPVEAARWAPRVARARVRK